MYCWVGFLVPTEHQHMVLFDLIAGKPANVDPKLPEKLIIGGDDANYDTTRHQIMLQLFYSNEWHFTCGGCIIAKTTVLTAHHCCDFPGFT